MQRLAIAAVVPLVGGALPGAAMAGPAAPSFAAPSDAASFPPSVRFVKRVETADVNGDGRVDVVVHDNFGSPPYQAEFNTFLNNGDGTLSPPVSTVVATEGSDVRDRAITLGDLNEDGRADLVTTRLAMTYSPQGNRPNLAVLFGAPDGRFVDQVDLPNSLIDVFMRVQSGRSIAIADVTGDGHLDIVSPAANASAGNLSVLPGNGDGTFQPPIQSGAAAGHGLTTTGDVDGDGDLDVVTASDVGNHDHARTAFYVSLNNGAGVMTQAHAFTLFVQENSIDTESRLWLSDLDGDGRADLTYYGDRGQQSGSGGLYVRRGAGDGTFSQVLHYQAFAAGGDSTFTVLNADFDGDGDVDIAKIPNPGHRGEVLVNDGTGVFTSAPIAPSASDAVCAFGQLAGSPLPDVCHYDDSYDNPRIQIAVNTTPLAPPGDVTADGIVNVDDLLSVINHWGRCADPDNCPADIADAPAGDDVVDVDDLLMVINHWG